MSESNVAESEGGSERRYILDPCEILVSVRIMSVYIKHLWGKESSTDIFQTYIKEILLFLGDPLEVNQLEY